jgi:hypothetical protein
VFENKMLREIFAPKWEEVTEHWRNYKLGSFAICISRHYSAGDVSEDEMDGNVDRMLKKKNAWRVLVRKRERK